MEINLLNELNQLDNEINNCNLCEDKITKFNHKSISIWKNRNLLFVWEAPAKNWRIVSWKAFFDKTNKLVPSWKILEKLLSIIWLNVEDITFIEAIKCLPTDRKYLTICWLNCNKFLLSQIDLLKPNIIISLWKSATKNILWDNYIHKKYKEIVWKKITIKVNWNDYIVIPIYHPSPISPLSYKWNIDIFEEIKENYWNIVCI